MSSDDERSDDEPSDDEKFEDDPYKIYNSLPGYHTHVSQEPCKWTESVPYGNPNNSWTPCGDTRYLRFPSDDHAGISDMGQFLTTTCEFDGPVRGFLFHRAMVSVVQVNGDKIGKASFAFCKNLYAVFVSENLKNIDSLAFLGCVYLKVIKTPYNCNYTTSTIPRGVFRIGCSAFEGCGLVRLDLSGCHSLKQIHPEAFKDCKSLKTCLLPECLEEIGQETFESCTKLKKIVLPANLRILGARAFADCWRLRVFFHESLKEIGDDAFESCMSVVKL